MKAARDQQGFRAVLLGTAVTVLCALPVFLTSTASNSMIEDLSFGEAQLGLAVGTFFGTGALLSPVMGRLVDRIGARRAIRIASLVAFVASSGIAYTVKDWGRLVVWLMIAGIAAAMAPPASNRLLALSVPADRLGVALGIKQSGPPLATMIAGLSVPLVVVTFGWRASFVVVAGLSVLVFLAAQSIGTRRTEASPAKSTVETAGLPALITAFALGTAAASCVIAFYVHAATEAGSSQSIAGSLFAAASLTAIATRVVAGLAADRMSRAHLRICEGLLAVGALGILLLATADPRVMTIGLLLALPGTWGFHGVFLFSLLRLYSDSPGRITGLVAPGAMLGSTLGPIVFGWGIGSFGLATGWIAASLAAALAALGMHLASHTPTKRTTHK